MRLCFFEDSGVHFLEPLALTRPAFALRLGAGTLLQHHCRLHQPAEVGGLIRPYLADLCRQQHPALRINDSAWAGQPGTVYVNARWVPNQPLTDLDRPRVGLIQDQVVYAIGAPPCPDASPEAIDGWLNDCKKSLPAVDAEGVLMEYLWDLIDHNGAALRRDWHWFQAKQTDAELSQVAVLGPRDQLVVAEEARLEPFVTADTRGGPVLIDSGAVVHSFSRLEGPCYIGKDSWVLGAKLRAESSIGPLCRVGGEVEASIIQGNSNKYHEGFLGHSYVGEWVNLAAGTHTSDLRNDYGQVRTTVAGQRLATGRAKLGSFIGDHTKTGLSALFNTGSVVGVFANVLPNGGLLPQVISSFCQVQYGELHERWDLRQMLGTAAIVMRRRGMELTEAHRELYYHLYDLTGAWRRAEIKEGERRRLRKII